MESVGSTKGEYSSKPEMYRIVIKRTHVRQGNPITQNVVCETIMAIELKKQAKKYTNFPIRLESF